MLTLLRGGERPSAAEILIEQITTAVSDWDVLGVKREDYFPLDDEKKHSLR